MNKKIIVKIDSELRDLVPGFIENRKRELPILLNAIDQRDFATLQDIGHRVSGSAGAYGFSRIGALGSIIESAAKEKKIETIESALHEFKFFLENFEIIYEH